MDHQLENLGPERFQQLCQAILVKEYPGSTCFPVGQPDGGRDAIQFDIDDLKSINVAFQIKFTRATPNKDTREWVLETAVEEAPKVKKLVERGLKKYIFITNVAGTAHLDAGSIDKLRTQLEALLGVPTVCWWRDDINRRLDGLWDLKLRYPEVLNGQDFLRLLLEAAPDDEQKRRLNAMRAFLADQYFEDVEVKFKQVELHNKLLDLFVDLPFTATVRQWAESSIQAPFPLYIRESPGAIVLGPQIDDDTDADCGTATLLLSEYADHYFQSVVVEGAPGQGKSTLSQYICQIQRIRLLNKSSDFECIPTLHKTGPVRIPFKVDLRDFSAWLSHVDPFTNAQASGDPKSLETFLARLVTHHSGGIDFSSNDLLELSKFAPSSWFLMA